MYNKQNPNVFAYSGNPNGQLAGNAASVSGGVPPDFAWDYTNGVLYACVTTGTALTATWAPTVGGAATGTVLIGTANTFGYYPNNSALIASLANGAAYQTPTYNGSNLIWYGGLQYDELAPFWYK